MLTVAGVLAALTAVLAIFAVRRRKITHL
ncbi:MAG: hypothetical protein ACM3Y8_05005 [Byssovorax cruenta]